MVIRHYCAYGNPLRCRQQKNGHSERSRGISSKKATDVSTTFDMTKNNVRAGFVCPNYRKNWQAQDLPLL